MLRLIQRRFGDVGTLARVARFLLRKGELLVHLCRTVRSGLAYLGKSVWT